MTSSQTLEFQFCAVCGRETNCCHFGALCCKACAAFFRRIVAGKKSYTCKYEEKCAIEPSRNPKLCPACRWQKCIAVGMQESAVLSAEAPPQPQRQINQEQQQLQLRPPSANAYNPAMMQTLQRFDYSANFSSYQNHEWLRKLLLVNQNVQHERMTILTPKSGSLGNCILDVFCSHQSHPATVSQLTTHFCNPMFAHLFWCFEHRFGLSKMFRRNLGVYICYKKETTKISVKCVGFVKT